MPTTTTTEKPMQVRTEVPYDVGEGLKALARREHRSCTKQILHILTQAVSDFREGEEAKELAVARARRLAQPKKAPLARNNDGSVK
jgi:plasmid stability protein